MESDPGVFTELIKGFGESPRGPSWAGGGLREEAEAGHQRLSAAPAARRLKGGDSRTLESGTGGGKVGLQPRQVAFPWRSESHTSGTGRCPRDSTLQD